MYTTLIAVALFGVCAAVAAVMLTVTLRRATTTTRTDVFLRCVAVAAICSVASSAMYLFYAVTPSEITVVVGDTGMMAGPALIWVGLCALGGVARRALPLVACAAAAMAATSALAPLEVALTVKLALIVLFCGLCVHATMLPALRGRPGTMILRVTNVVYAAFSASRVAVGALAGGDSELYAAGFSTGPTTVVGFGAVVATGAGCLMIARDPHRRPVAPTATKAPGWRVSIPDFAIMPAAYGGTSARLLHRRLLAVCREVDPAAASERRGTVVMHAEGAWDEIERRVQARFAQTAAGGEVEVLEPLTFERLG